ncbi:MFS transporter [Bosea thiooxidans]|uniref:MFS transporter n=1 Tax=Bosea thiooxidans TaxID=53254 RepID=A0A0Q3I2L4_9HYPH|nr:MFS transporter [Bosea thiooxidans]KQK29207.1 MFS transporter [Bosea thiooxidans]SKB40460.1 Predicted arabinose efflux permease, MFS family [Bosea thiooxidans]
MDVRKPAAGTGPFAPLKNVTFRAIWLAGLISGLGWLIQTIAMSWLMATITPSSMMVALVQAATNLPAFILSIFAGAIVDNFNRRKVMLIARSLMALTAATLTALVAVGLINPWIILFFSFLAGCCIAFNDPAWQASVGDIVDRKDLAAAVTLTSVGFNTVRSVGPALGGIILATFGPLTAFCLYTLGHFAPLIVVWRSKWKVPVSRLPPEAMLTAISDGLRFTSLSAEIKTALARGFLFGLAGIAILALLPLVVRDQLKQGAVAYGVLMAGFGAGALLAGLTSTALRRRLSDEQLLKLACVACAACTLSLSLTQTAAVAVPALMLGGAGWVLGWSGLSISVQWASPRWVVGRTISLYYALTSCGLAVGSWLWGMVTESHSLGFALQASTAASLGVAILGLVLPIHQRKDADVSTPDHFEAPAISLDLKPRSGPIAVKIEYRIAADQVEPFLALMLQRRRAQGRNGARRWILTRNLHDTAIWTETFRTPTWNDYLRFNYRQTAADRALDARLVDLHMGHEAPEMTLAIERPTATPRKAGVFSPGTHHS